MPGRLCGCHCRRGGSRGWVPAGVARARVRVPLLGPGTCLCVPCVPACAGRCRCPRELEVGSPARGPVVPGVRLPVGHSGREGVCVLLPLVGDLKGSGEGGKKGEGPPQNPPATPGGPACPSPPHRELPRDRPPWAWPGGVLTGLSQVPRGLRQTRGLSCSWLPPYPRAGPAPPRPGAVLSERGPRWLPPQSVSCGEAPLPPSSSREASREPPSPTASGSLAALTQRLPSALARRGAGSRAWGLQRDRDIGKAARR